MCESRTRPVAAVQAIIDMVTELEANGSIEEGEVAENLRVLLARARTEIGVGDHEAAVRSLARFIDHLERQTPHHITESAARTLIEWIVSEDWRDVSGDNFFMYV
jgi:hypothetical protein